MVTTRQPAADEYAPAFADYVASIGEDEDVVAVLADQLDEFLARLDRVSQARGDHRYAPDKWSVKEIVGHLADTERVFACRALRFARGDATPLPSFEDQAYVLAQRAGDRALTDLSAEWGDIRRATLSLFRNLPAAAWSRQGIASDQPISVRALAYVITGHLRHHLEVLAARYDV